MMARIVHSSVHGSKTNHGWNILLRGMLAIVMHVASSTVLVLTHSLPILMVFEIGNTLRLVFRGKIAL